MQKEINENRKEGGCGQWLNAVLNRWVLSDVLNAVREEESLMDWGSEIDISIGLSVSISIDTGSVYTETKMKTHRIRYKKRLPSTRNRLNKRVRPHETV